MNALHYSPEQVLRRFVLEHLKQPVLVLDREGRLLEANRAARAAELFEPEQLLGGAHLGRLKDLLRAAEREGSARLELAVEQPGGRRRLLSLEAFRVDAWFVLTIADSAEQARDQELRELRRVESLGLLAASAVHDLSNLLTPIVCLSSMLSKELGQEGRSAEMMAELESAARSAAALIRDVLGFARSGARSVEPVDPNAVVRTLEPLLRRLLGDRIELVLALDDSLGQIVVERSQLEQAILNLVVNARNAMPAGGKVTIRTANLGDAVSLSVSDDGAGMSEQVRSSAFDRFFTTRRAEGRAGLGLSSVQRFASESGGSAKLESTPGSGTTVTLKLPRAAAP